MAIYKCKMCGAQLDIQEKTTVAECDYCGTKQTMPTSTDETIQGMFNRANVLRMKSEFDKAEQIYEKILQANDTQAEAYWGLILCKFGIEYVEDPKTFKRIPTCHRTSFDSIIADDDYKSALHHADDSQRVIYEAEATEIDRLQKEALALSQQEDPYDVFICYKETDDSGKRTQDSVIANDIYHQLTAEGFKVFYAAISLEDKLGSAYEPCIFAALHSAKVMLAIGTKPEYFNAVWVKNEWSRYLKMMKTDRSKLLIPCYRDMDAYELPDEFSHLQSQDMSKIGFINDVVRGIKKILVKDHPTTSKSAPADIPTASPTVTSLLKRAFMALEDEEWSRADEFCEQALNIDPESASGYLVKLMVDLKASTKIELKKQTTSFAENKNYQKLLRFGDQTLLEEINGYLECVLNTIREHEYALEQEKQKKAMYQKALEEQHQKKLLEEQQKREQIRESATELETLLKQFGSQDEISKQQDALQITVYGQRHRRDTCKQLQENFDQVFSTWQELNTQEQALTNELSALDREKQNLGLFALKQKKEINAKADNLRQQLNTLQQKLSPLTEQLQSCRNTDDVEKQIRETEDALQDSLARQQLLKETFARKAALISLLKNDTEGKKLLESIQVQHLLKQYEIGSVITFGSYGAKIPWLVLDVQGEDVLLFSQHIVDFAPYLDVQGGRHVPFENSTLKTFLNTTFKPRAFTSDEQKHIINLFILKLEEIAKYESVIYSKPCRILTDQKRSYNWWTSSPGAEIFFGNTGCSIEVNGSVNNVSDVRINYGVRPAMWFSLRNFPTQV